MNTPQQSSPERPTQLNEMVIRSVDTLCHTEINQIIPSTWNDRPPLLNKMGKNGVMVEETELLLKGMIRTNGIPPALRCAVQLSNIIQRVHGVSSKSRSISNRNVTSTTTSPQYWYDYRTLAKVQVLDFAYDSLLHRILTVNSNNDIQSSTASTTPTVEEALHHHQQVSPPTHTEYSSIWESMDVSRYGRTESIDEEIPKLIPQTTKAGLLSLKRVLIAIEQCIAVEYVPLLPILTAVLLTNMSESYTFTAIREMTSGNNNNSYYFPSSRIEHVAWCYAFGHVIKKLHPQTASYLEDRGVLDVKGLQPIFYNFFMDVLPLEYVVRIMDIYTLEGSKVLFRFGIALFVLYKTESAEQLITISTADEWWHTMKLWAHSRRFRFDVVVRKAYGVHGSNRHMGLRGQILRFPRRAIIQRIVRMEIDRISTSDELSVDGIYQEPPARPLGVVRPQPMPPDTYGNPGEDVKAILVQSVQVRQHIAQWLPLTLRLTDLNLIYSTSYHGRTLERFYEHVKYAKNTLVICEVLLPLPSPDIKSTQSSTVPSSSSTCIIGMYASQQWHISTQVYGDGGCFLFRLEPNAVCWKWQPHGTKKTTNQHDHHPTSLLDHLAELEIDDSNSIHSGGSNSNNNKAALLEQFMVSTKDYISMGGNPDGTCGLRLNEDLTKGESSTADGFDNEPLHQASSSSSSSSSLFEIGLVEVYGLVRQIDGRPV